MKINPSGLKMAVAIPEEAVQSKIYLIREQKVMLDRDLAALYGVTTKAMNQAVKRNLRRFPGDFMFLIDPKGDSELEVTICDLQPGENGDPSKPPCFHRARYFDALKCPEQRESHPSQYPDHANLLKAETPT